MDYYSYLQESSTLSYTMEYISEFKKKLDYFYDNQKHYEENKEKYISHINNMLNYVNNNPIIDSSYVKGLIELIQDIKYENDIVVYKYTLNRHELILSIIFYDLNIQVQLSRDERIFNHKCNIVNILKIVRYMLKDIDNMLKIHDEIFKIYDKKLNFYSYDKVEKYKIDDVNAFIENIDNFENQIIQLKNILECYEYHNSRKYQTMDCWKQLKDEFFEISYHPDLFKKIVLDEKEVCLFT